MSNNKPTEPNFNYYNISMFQQNKWKHNYKNHENDQILYYYSFNTSILCGI